MSEIKENKMGVMPVTKLLFNMSLPIMLSMFVMACYNIVDSIFVAKINENALTAISLAFPVQTLMTAVSIGTAVGVNALLAMRLGEKNQDAVNKIAVNGLFLAICSYVVFFVLSIFFVKPYLVTQTTNSEIVQFGEDYLNIILKVSIASFVATMSDRLLQATGRTFFTMITQLVGTIANIILDPIMIFGLGPIPAMGVAGAAWATVIGQILSALTSVYFNVRKNTDIHFILKGFKPNKTIIGQIYKIGVPSILLQSINSVTSYGMNLIIGAFSDTAIAVFGSYFKLNSFVFMPVFGLTTGMVPIISYNYGAQKMDRIKKTVNTTMRTALAIMLIGVAIFELFPDKLLKLFNASENMLEIGCPALRIIAPSFLGAAIAVTFGSTFQALGKSFLSMIISFMRQIVVLLPVAYLLSKTGVLQNVWCCFLVAEIFAVVLSLIFMHNVKKNLLKNKTKSA